MGLNQGSQFHTVPTRIYRTGKQSSTYNPPVSYRKKFQPISGNTSRYARYRPIQKKVFIFYFLSFVIFEFLLGQNGNLFALTY